MAGVRSARGGDLVGVGKGLGHPAVQDVARLGCAGAFRVVRLVRRELGAVDAARALWSGRTFSSKGSEHAGRGARHPGVEVVRGGTWMSRVIEPESIATGNGIGGVPTRMVIQ